MSTLLRRLGGACAARPRRVITAWLLAAAVLSLLAWRVGGSYSQERSLPGTEVATADARLQAHFPSAADVSADLLLHDPDAGRLDEALPQVLSAVADLPHARPIGPTDVRWSADRRTAWLPVRYDVGRFVLDGSDLAALEAAGRSSGVEAQVTGELFADLNTPGAGLGEKLGVGAALLILLLAFGSVFAALMPVAMAALAIVSGLALVRLLSSAYSVSDSAPVLATMLGLGVGIDYALFIVTRHREGVRAGLAPRDAVTSAVATAGTSVTWAGITVVAAICGLAFAGIPLMTSLGFASAIVVATSVLAAVTLLPALLAVTGRNLDRLHLGLPHLRHDRGEPGWARWARHIDRRPVRYVVGSTLLLGVLASPVASIRLGFPDGSAAPAGSEARAAFALMSEGFGVGANGPLRLVVALPAAADPSVVADAIRSAVTRDPAVVATGPMQLSPDRTTGLITVVPDAGPQAERTSELVPRLRDRVLPPVERATGARTWVTGLPAGRYDVAQRVVHRLPWFVGAVLAVSFLLLMAVFQSVLVPLKAVLLNLLSIAAALGVVVAVFSWGWLKQLVGVSETVPLVDVIPMMMFAIVFGLSMDYEVFLLSRVREHWLVTGDSRESVVLGLTSTARVISAAAAIMVSVFLAFTLSSDVIVKMMGLGLAVAVLLDATVIRLVLVPATMALLGDLNWWFPGRKRRQVTDVPIARPTP